MDSASLDALKDNFTAEIDKVRTCLLLRNCSEDDSCLEELQTLSQDIDKITLTMKELKTEIAERKSKLAQLDKLNAMYRRMGERLSYMVNNIPDRLPKPPKEPTCTPVEVLPVKEEAPVPIPASLPSSAVKVEAKKPSSGKQPNVYVPQLDYLTVEEFEQTPKYQRGRLTYDQMNKFIDGFNLAYKAKYKIMKMKKSTMKGHDRKRYDDYILQENKDTAGSYFVVEQDLKDLGALKIDKVSRSMITLLRHCGRIREVRGGNLTRYKYVDSY